MPRVLRYGRRFNERWFKEADFSLLEGEPLTRHTIVCGYGRLGAVLVDVLCAMVISSGRLT